MSSEREQSAAKLPKEVQRRLLDLESTHSLHQLHANEEEERGDQQFNIRLPFSDLREWIYERDEIYQAYEAFPSWRLSRIRQLSFLAYVGPNPESQYFHEFNHTRFEHTLIAAKLMEKVLERNGATKHNLKVGIAAAMAHDQATPALGDATKKLDPVNLDEEDHWYEVMEEKGKEYLKANGISREEIDDAIHNRGLLGKVLDIVDRISYVMLDVGQLLSVENLESIINSSQAFGYRAEIAMILNGDTNVGSIYRDISINWETGEVYFTNPERLSRFLELRALLGKYLYMHPVSQARDFMVMQTLKPFYSVDENDETKLTPSKLRRMADDDALQFISGQEDETTPDAMQSRYIRVYNAFVRWFPQFYTKVDTKRALKEKRKEIESNGNLLVNAELESKGFNPATNYLVQDDAGIVLPFREYDPKCAGRIERIADSVKGYILFWQKKGPRADLEYNPDLINDFPTNLIPIL